MFRFMVPVLLFTSGAISLHYDPYKPQLRQSAASNAQIRFAIENKYDNTGPGAKGPTYAYDTYKTLDDALVSFLGDPDTKLPQFEKIKGVQKLYQSQNNDQQTINFNPKEIKPLQLLLPTLTDKNILYNYNGGMNFQAFQPSVFNNDVRLQGVNKLRAEPLKVHKFQLVKASPLNLAHFTREPEFQLDLAKPNPSYSYSYGVHDKKTGDSKSAQETKDGNVVTGYYTFLDADGKQRTVHYTADDKQGFRAVVSRTHTNGQ